MTAKLYLPESARPIPCTYQIRDNSIVIQYSNPNSSYGNSSSLITENFKFSECKPDIDESPCIGFQLPDDRRIEVADSGLWYACRTPQNVKMKSDSKLINRVLLFGAIGFFLSIGGVVSMYFFPQYFTWIVPNIVNEVLGDAVEELMVKNKRTSITSKADSICLEFVQAMHWPESDTPNIVIVQGDFFNAFTLPNDKIIITDSAILTMPSVESLIGVLGHEYGHKAEEHIAQNIVQSGLSILVSLFIDGGMLFEYATSLSGLQYSRQHELEADKIGGLILTLNGYEASTMLKVMEILADLEKKAGTNTPEFTQTHPKAESRIEAVKLYEKVPLRAKQNSKLQILFEELQAEIKSSR